MFNGIAIVRKIGDGNHPDVEAIANHLHVYGKERNLDVYDYHLDTHVPELASKVLFIAIGGDGTMIHASKESLKYNESYVMGINYGNLGFLAEDNLIDPNNLAMFLDHILFQHTIHNTNSVKLCERMAIEARHKDDSFISMNEFVISTGMIGPPFNYKIYVNDQPVGTQHGSGVLISTSTGSTAMALSAGGAIIHPSTNVMQIVPLIAHSLTARPVIISSRDSVTVSVTTTERTSKFSIISDGRIVKELNGDVGMEHRINIQRYDTVKIWRPADTNFFDILARKMQW